MDKARGLLSLIAVLAGLLVAAGPADEPKADDVLSWPPSTSISPRAPTACST